VSGTADRYLREQSLPLYEIHDLDGSAERLHPVEEVDEPGSAAWIGVPDPVV
jgi:hypothetical protein